MWVYKKMPDTSRRSTTFKIKLLTKMTFSDFPGKNKGYDLE